MADQEEVRPVSRHEKFDGPVVKGKWHLDEMGLWFEGEHALGPNPETIHAYAMMLADEPRVSINIGEGKGMPGGLVMLPSQARELADALRAAADEVERPA